ncbi:MAG: SH3 domain-containing protein [Polyangiales bacterium]
MSVRALALSLLLSLAPAQVAARDDEPARYARVVVERAALRSGPGASFRVLMIAQRDDSFEVVGRGPVGHWLAITLGDGARAYVAGDAVWLFDARDEPDAVPPHAASIFAAAPLMRARGELAISLGSLSGSGLMAVRPVVLLAPTFGIELSLGASVGARGRLFFAGLGGIVNLFPRFPVTPFLAGGGGGVRAYPNADALALEAGGRSLVYGGGGLRIAFKHRIVLRVEARSFVLFDADRLDAQQELSGGFSALF